MLNSTPFSRPDSHSTPRLGECIFRTRAIEQWRECIAAYDEIIQMLEGAADKDYGFIHGGAERVRLASTKLSRFWKSTRRTRRLVVAQFELRLF
jgi:hypothetical protein